MDGAAWHAMTHCLAVELVGGQIDVDDHGDPTVGDNMLLLFNADNAHSCGFCLPPPANGAPWRLVLDTARPDKEAGEDAGKQYEVDASSMVVFCSRSPMRDQEA